MALENRTFHLLIQTGHLDVLPTRGDYSKTEEFFRRSIATKYRGWSYEQEWRVFEPTSAYSDGSFSFMPFDENVKLKEVITGDQCKTTREEVNEALAGYPHEISILKASRSHSAFEMIIDDWDGATSRPLSIQV